MEKLGKWRDIAQWGGLTIALSGGIIDFFDNDLGISKGILKGMKYGGLALAGLGILLKVADVLKIKIWMGSPVVHNFEEIQEIYRKAKKFV